MRLLCASYALSVHTIGTPLPSTLVLIIYLSFDKQTPLPACPQQSLVLEAAGLSVARHYENDAILSAAVVAAGTAPAAVAAATSSGSVAQPGGSTAGKTTGSGLLGGSGHTKDGKRCEAWYWRLMCTDACAVVVWNGSSSHTTDGKWCMAGVDA